MNEQFIIEFIRQRMEELCVRCYHFEPFFYAALKGGETFRLNNEIWYLVGLPDSVIIASDTAYYASGTIPNVIHTPEFTGQVRIASTIDVSIPLHFIRVIIQTV